MNSRATSKLAAITAMAAALGASSQVADPQESKTRKVKIHGWNIPNPKGLLQNAAYPKGHVPSGCKKFYFNGKGELMPEIKVGLTSFICHAYNEKSARKKFQKWQDQKNNL